METITIYLFVGAHICTGIILFRNQLIFSVRGGLRMFKLDRGCAMVGGICMDIDDCDPEHLSTTTGLCPSHKNKNVECCYRCKKIDFLIIKIPHIIIRPLIVDRQAPSEQHMRFVPGGVHVLLPSFNQTQDERLRGSVVLYAGLIKPTAS